MPDPNVDTSLTGGVKPAEGEQGKPAEGTPNEGDVAAKAAAKAAADAEAAAKAAADAEAAKKAAEGGDDEAAKKAADEAAKKAADEAAKGAPEKYEFVTPDGVELDDEVKGEFETFARELNLPQDVAQKGIDMALKLQQRWEANVQEALAQQRVTWADQAKKDPEIGGKKFDESLAKARAVMREVATPDLIEMLESTGLTAHPEMLRAFAKLGGMISPDRFVKGEQRGQGPKALHDRIYGGSK